MGFVSSSRKIPSRTRNIIISSFRIRVHNELHISHANNPFSRENIVKPKEVAEWFAFGGPGFKLRLGHRPFEVFRGSSQLPQVNSGLAP